MPSSQLGEETSPAQAFVTFAKTGTDEVPWSDAVTYSIGGVEVGTFHPGPTFADSLSACLPGKTEVEGHTCPVSPLKTLAEVADDAALESALPDHGGCNKFAAPQTPLGTTPTVIRPPEDRRDCFTDFAITLFVNDSDQVAWIDFALSGP